MLSRLDIAFLPRSKCLLISWLQSLSALIVEPPKIKSVTVSIASPTIWHEGMGPDAMILVFWMLMVNENCFLESCTNISFRYDITWNYFTKCTLALCSPDATHNRKFPIYSLFLGWRVIHPLIPWLSSLASLGNIFLSLKHSADFLWYPLGHWSRDLIYA